MPAHRVLEIEQPHARHARPLGEPEEVLGVIVALDEHAVEAGQGGEMRLQELAEPRAQAGLRAAGDAEAIPVHRERGEIGHRRGAIGRETGGRGVAVQLHQKVGGRAVEHILLRRIPVQHARIERVAQILEQQQARIGIFGEDGGRREPEPAQVPRDGRKRGGHPRRATAGASISTARAPSGRMRRW